MQFFWDMFIADALPGNFDRHNGNWGILVDEEHQTAEIAPVQKEFYQIMLKERKEKILDYSIERLLKPESREQENRIEMQEQEKRYE